MPKRGCIALGSAFGQSAAGSMRREAQFARMRTGQEVLWSTPWIVGRAMGLIDLIGGEQGHTAKVARTTGQQVQRATQGLTE